MKLSVIIPAYNSEKTLECAIESVLTRFTEREIILINDGSTDGTGEICNRYAKQYSDIIAIHTENRGVSSARNTGIERATGDFIFFMDADDQIICKSNMDLTTYIKDYDLVMFSFNEKSMNDIILKTYKFKNEDIIKSEISNAFLRYKYGFYGPWGKLFRRKIIIEHGIKFNVGQKYGEDIVFVLSYLSNVSNKIRLVSDLIYCHYINPNGTSFFEKYYPKMNEYLFEQIKAYEALIDLNDAMRKEKIEDFACCLFNDVIVHYYQKVGFHEFLNKYVESYKLFSIFLDVNKLKKYSFFKKMNVKNTNILEYKFIRKLYQKNLYFKIKYNCKHKLVRVINNIKK